MDPVTALGVASGAVALVDFTSKVLSTTYKFATSTASLPDYLAGLDDVAMNMKELSGELKARDLADISKANVQLHKLCEESRQISIKLLAELQRIRVLGLKDKQSKWNSLRQALLTVWSEKDIRKLEERLATIRRKLDTTLLTCLSQQLDRLPSKLGAYVRQPNDSPGETPEWQLELLHELRRNRWDAERGSDIDDFASELTKSTRSDNKKRFSRLVRSRLLFEQLTDREEGIRDAHTQTLNWVFDETITKGGTVVNFSEWLQSECDGTIYWITGKPGSGKSTLMKFIHHDPRTAQYLARWSPDSGRLFRAAFFFWNPGSKIQKSRDGLLRSLLYQIICEDWTVTNDAFRERWELYDAYGGGLRQLSWEELRRAFTRIISDSTRRFFFLVDGLDEFDGDATQLCELVLEASKLPHVKLCISSRPLLVFEDYFVDKPSLTMEKGSEDDIHVYVTSKFLENRHYRALQTRNKVEADRLVDNVTHKSAGVFLWVYLVVNSLLTGLSNSDRISDLQQRLDDLPSELSELFDRLLSSVEPRYYQHACQLVLVVEAFKDYGNTGVTTMRQHASIAPFAASELPLLLLAFADEENLASVLGADRRTLTNQAAELREEDMRRRLNSRCRGLFESSLLGDTRCIAYLHRTAREYVKTPTVWEKLVSAAGADFDANLSLCVGTLMMAKAGPRGRYNLPIGTMTQSLYHARAVKEKTPSFYVAYLDEFTSILPPTDWLNCLGFTYLQRSNSKPSTLLEFALLIEGPVAQKGSGVPWARTQLGDILTLYTCGKIESMAPLTQTTRKRLLSLSPSSQVVAAIQNASATTEESDEEDQAAQDQAAIALGRRRQTRARASRRIRRTWGKITNVFKGAPKAANL